MSRISASAAVLAAFVATAAAQASSEGRNSGATITGAFSDACRDFSAHSSKDISYVELHYAAGFAVKDESIGSPDHAIDGGAGDEIALATVKSGTTVEEFPCALSNSAPTALLEIQTPPLDHALDHCYWFWDGGLACYRSSERTAWTNNSQVPDTGGGDSGLFHWVQGDPFPCLPPCASTVTFRGIGSFDPDGDIVSWTLDFGDCTSVSGTWNAPPTELTHDYAFATDTCGGDSAFAVTLTVTDSAGQSHSDRIRMVFLDMTPD